MRAILRIVDCINDRVGGVASWLAVALVLLVSLEVIRRFVFRAPSMWGYESCIMVGVGLYVFGWAYAHRHEAHIRVDVLSAHLPRRVQALVNVLGYLIVFFPLVALFTYSSFIWAIHSWETGEKMVHTLWRPPVAPLRTLILIASFLLLLQGVTHFTRDLYLLIRNETYD